MANFEQEIQAILGSAARQIVEAARHQWAGLVKQIVGEVGMPAAQTAPKAPKAKRRRRVDKTPLPTSAAKMKARGANKAAAGKTAKRKRTWPNCGETGCGKPMYGPSGSARLCYLHFVASGGKPANAA